MRYSLEGRVVHAFATQREQRRCPEYEPVSAGQAQGVLLRYGLYIIHGDVPPGSLPNWFREAIGLRPVVGQHTL